MPGYFDHLCHVAYLPNQPLEGFMYFHFSSGRPMRNEIAVITLWWQKNISPQHQQCQILWLGVFRGIKPWTFFTPVTLCVSWKEGKVFHGSHYLPDKVWNAQNPIIIWKPARNVKIFSQMSKKTLCNKAPAKKLPSAYGQERKGMDVGQVKCTSHTPVWYAKTCRYTVSYP